MEAWSGWELGRVVLLLSAVMYMGIWIQVSLYHRAGGFKKLAMWGPVLTTPLIAGGAVAGAFVRDGVWGWIAAGLLSIGIVQGLVGFMYHLNGIRRQIGGFTVRNLLAGPPPVLPIAYTMIGIVGLVGLAWNG